MNGLTVERIKNGAFKQNCYIVSNTRKFALIIDPGSEASRIISEITEKGLTPLAIVNTHGHFDHIGAVVELVEKYAIPFYLHEADARLVKSANIYRLLFKTKTLIEIPKIDNPISADIDRLVIGDFDVEVIQTPGHTPGGICLIIEDVLFTGDTLMGAGPGTTSLPGGDPTTLESSIKRLRNIDGNFLVYPGHGRALHLKDIWERYDAD